MRFEIVSRNRDRFRTDIYSILVTDGERSQLVVVEVTDLDMYVTHDLGDLVTRLVIEKLDDDWFPTWAPC